jgi:hypothetical protein
VHEVFLFKASVYIRLKTIYASEIIDLNFNEDLSFETRKSTKTELLRPVLYVEFRSRRMQFKQ